MLWGGWGKLGRNILHGSSQKVCKINFEKSKSHKVEKFNIEFRNVEKVKKWEGVILILKSRQVEKCKGFIAVISKSRKECHMKNYLGTGLIALRCVHVYTNMYVKIYLCTNQIHFHIHVQTSRIYQSLMVSIGMCLCVLKDTRGRFANV